MPEKQVRVVQVGCGGMGRNWCRIAREHPEIHLVGLVDLNREAAVNMAEKHELPETVVFDSLAAAVKQTSPDAVFDVTIPAAHRAVTLEALDLGCHVLGEKPMCDTLDNARKMVAKASETGKTYAVAQTRRPNSHAVAVSKAIADGVVGRVEEVHADFYIGARFTKGFRAEMDHPLIVDMAIHTFDQGRQLAGATPTSVYCHTFNPGHSWYRHHGSAVAIYECADDVVYSYRGSWCAEGLNTSWNAFWRIIGEKGTLTWDGSQEIKCQLVDPQHADADDFFRKLVDVEVPVEELPRQGHEGIIYNFVDHLLRGEALWCPCEDNIKSFAMVCSAVASSASGQREPISV